jgi:hypothetical protein
MKVVLERKKVGHTPQGKGGLGEKRGMGQWGWAWL